MFLNTKVVAFNEVSCEQCCNDGHVDLVRLQAACEQLKFEKPLNCTNIDMSNPVAIIDNRVPFGGCGAIYTYTHSLADVDYSASMSQASGGIGANIYILLFVSLFFIILNHLKL